MATAAENRARKEPKIQPRKKQLFGQRRKNDDHEKESASATMSLARISQSAKSGKK